MDNLATSMPQPCKSSQLWEAIDIYLRVAYEEKVPPAVAARVQALRDANAEPLGASCVERDAPSEPRRYSVRLGNRFYPHMKLVVDCTNAAAGCVFRADAHDAHCQPKPGSPEMTAYQELVDRNRKIATEIEDAWTQQGLPTFKAYLRADLARRARREK